MILLFAISANDNYMLKLFGWNGSYKYIKTIYWLKDRESERKKERERERERERVIKQQVFLFLYE